MNTTPVLFEILYQNPADPTHYLREQFDGPDAAADAVAFGVKFGVALHRMVGIMGCLCQMPYRDTGMSVVADDNFTGPNNGLTLVLLAPDA